MAAGGAQAEEQKSMNEAERYRLLVDAITDYAIYMLDPSGVVTSWNAGAQRFKGYTRDEIIGQHFSRFYSPEDVARGLPARALEISAREGKFESEGWRVRRDGTQFWAHVIIDPIRAADGTISGFAKVTRDLTERKKADLALRQSEEQFRLLVQGVTDYAIYMLDPTGVVTSWNPGAQRIKGYTPAEIVGQHFSKFYTAEDRASGEPQKALGTAQAAGRFEKEGWRVRKDGSKFWCHVIIDAIRSETGELIGFAKITRDNTERRQAQINLEKAREALFQAQKMDAVGQLTGGVAHDFNNLLMAVMGSLELLRRRLPDDEAMHRLLENAMMGAKRGASLTQRMLSFARRQDLNPQPVDLLDLVRNMTELLQRSVGAQTMVQTQFPLALDKVMADANQLELALLNLSVNARDAMPDGGTVVIAARDQMLAKDNEIGLPPASYVCLSVTDQGAGMDADTLARATEPFFTTKGVGKGTGLGLPMVHGMAEQMGGRLVLRSKPGEGTVVELWLKSAGRDAGHIVAATAPAADADTSAKDQLRILAVDDDALVLFNTVAMLEDLGHTVLEAGSGADALAALQRGPVDVVITDQAMPGMTGLQLIQAIKTQWPDTAIVLATGYAEIPGGADAGIPRLAKPFDERDLVKALAKTKVKAQPVA
jgi:PAS domain S-box-containing protein